MSIATNLQRLVDAKSDIADAITAKGGTVNSGDGLEEFPDDIASIPGGGNSKKVVPQCELTNAVPGFPNSFNGKYVWTDGDNIYFSNGFNQYILNKTTSTWTTKTWIGLASLFGNYIWTDGDNIYYSIGSDQYVLYVANKEALAWNSKTWSGLTSFGGKCIWTDGDNIYYSTGSTQYVLDKATSTWNTKTWSGLTSFSANGIWTDGKNIYYSNGTGSQYVLNKDTSTWDSKSWYGLTNPASECIWTDGIDVYYSSNGDSYSQYVLDRNSGIWSTKSWGGLGYHSGSYSNNAFIGKYVWTDGENIYYCYKQNTTTTPIQVQIATSNKYMFYTDLSIATTKAVPTMR